MEEDVQEMYSKCTVDEADVRPRTGGRRRRRRRRACGGLAKRGGGGRAEDCAPLTRYATSIDSLTWFNGNFLPRGCLSVFHDRDKHVLLFLETRPASSMMTTRRRGIDGNGANSGQQRADARARPPPQRTSVRYIVDTCMYRTIAGGFAHAQRERACTNSYYNTTWVAVTASQIIGSHHGVWYIQ
jgi:hypothetical protein